MDILKQLCSELNIKEEHCENVIKLLDEGNTVPFIARYRKELTGSMDDQLIRELSARLDALRALEERKAEITRLIDEQGKLTDELVESINNAKLLTELEDIYRPYRPKRKTRASVAREKGLEPLADLIAEQKYEGDIYEKAEEFTDAEKGVESAEDAVSGAKDIIAENISDNADYRKDTQAYISRCADYKQGHEKRKPRLSDVL